MSFIPTKYLSLTASHLASAIQWQRSPLHRYAPLVAPSLCARCAAHAARSSSMPSPPHWSVYGKCQYVCGIQRTKYGTVAVAIGDHIQHKHKHSFDHPEPKRQDVGLSRFDSTTRISLAAHPSPVPCPSRVQARAVERLAWRRFIETLTRSCT